MKAEESSILAGGKFLPGNTAESMRSRQLDVKDPKAAARLLAYIMRNSQHVRYSNILAWTAAFLCTWVAGMGYRM